MNFDQLALFHALPYVCNTACVVAMGENEAKITSVFNSVVYLIGEADDEDMEMDNSEIAEESDGEDTKKKTAGAKKKKRKTATKRKTKKGK